MRGGQKQKYLNYVSNTDTLTTRDTVCIVAMYVGIVVLSPILIMLTVIYLIYKVFYSLVNIIFKVLKGLLDDYKNKR